MKLDHIKQNNEVSEPNEDNEVFSIPICISDLIKICKEYNKLGWNIQTQVENLLENGVEDSIKSGIVKRESLPHIKYFLQQIINNAYFGEATSEAQDCLYLIENFLDKTVSKLN